MRLRTAAFAALASLVILSGCTPDDSSPDEAAEQGSDRPGPSTIDDAGYAGDPQLSEGLAAIDFALPAETGDSSETAKGRAKILSLDRSGDTVRMVGAWLRSSEGPSLGSEAMASGLKIVTNRPWARLIDEEGGKVYEPLQEPEAEDGNFDRKDMCLCTERATGGSPRPGGDEPVELFWVDFPAPESDSVRLSLGEFSAPTEALPISDGEPFSNPIPDGAQFDEDPPAEYGSSDAKRTVLPIRENVKSVVGSRQTKADDQMQLSVTSDVLFDFDSSKITSEGKKVLESASKTLAENAKGQTVTIVGHTDDQGEEAYNQKLSEERAQSVEKELTGMLGDSGITLKTEGRGEKEPLVPNVDADGKPIEENRKQNRRVSFDYTPTGDAEGASIDTGEKLPKAPEMKETDAAEGAAASAILKQPGDLDDVDLRVDLRGLEADGDYARLDYAFALADENAEPDLGFFVGTEQLKNHLHFGLNAYGNPGVPSGTNVSLIDEETGEQFLPVTGGDADCLCTEGAGTGRGAFAEPSPMFSMFPAEVLKRDKLTLRIADSGTWPLTVSELRTGEQE